MQNFVFENPTRILFGKGSIAKIGQEVKRFGSKALLVYGRGSIKKNGIYEQVTTSLSEAGVGYVELGGVKSNPVLSLALKGVETARKERVDVVLAVGGGSVIDTAKTIAVGVKAEDDIWEYFQRRKTIRDALPVLTVVTISASASEMNPAAVITREERAEKFSIRSPLIQPKTSILDPTVLFSLGRDYTAYSAVDAVTHALEGYFTNTEPESPLQDRMVEGIVKTVMESAESSLKNPEEYNARANMMWAATLAFNGLTAAGMGTVAYPVHMMGHSLSALYDTPHGASLSVVLPGWMTFTLKREAWKFARFAREVFGVEDEDDVKAALEGVSLLKAWFASVGSPTSLQRCGIPVKDIVKLSENAASLARTWGLTDYTEEVIARIFSLCG